MNFFAHMIMHHNKNVDTSYLGSNHLGLDISHRQQECVRHTKKDLHIGQEIRDSTGDSAMWNIAKRKFTTLGSTQEHCKIVNSKDNTERMTQ